MLDYGEEVTGPLQGAQLADLLFHHRQLRCLIVLDLKVADRGQLDTAVATLRRRFSVPADDLRVDRAVGRVQVPVFAKSLPLTTALRALDDEQVAVTDLALRRPSLDDVFLKLTGRTA